MAHIESLPRICFLTEAFHPVVGGAETHGRLLAEKLIERGGSVFVVTRRRTSQLKKHDNVGRIPLYRVPPSGFQRWGKYLMMLPALVRLVHMRRQYDIIYVCGLRVLGVIGVIGSYLLKKKCVLRSESCTEMSGDFIWDAPNVPKTTSLLSGIELLLSMRNIILKKAARFISISTVIRDEFMSCGVKPENIEHIPNGIDVHKFKPVDEQIKLKLRQKLNIPSKIIFTYTGKLNRGKGLELLLQVWQKVVTENNNVHLLLVGAGDYQFLSCEEELRSYVKEANLQKRVTFTGYVENVHEYLQCSDYFILPSESEAHPVSLLEALSCELPCIATKAGGIVDIIKHDFSGKLIDIGNEHQLYHSIIKLLNDTTTAKQMGTNGREYILIHFSIENIANKHLLLFSGLIGGKHS